MRRTLLLFLALLLWRMPMPACAAAAVDRESFVVELLAVAEEELGYTRAKSGYTKYAEWSGANKYSEWCSNFVSWCVNQADERLGVQYLGELYPMQTACATGVRWFTERGRYVSATGALKGYGAQWWREDGMPLIERPYVPRPGDLIYFEWYKYNRIDHVGIVTSVDKTADGNVRIHTIEGNPRDFDYVKRLTYLLDDPSIRAYGITREDIGTELRPSCKGPLVTALQQQLNDGGWADFRPDGFYGSKTTAAVKKLQKEYGLEVTGIADRETQEALGFWFDG